MSANQRARACSAVIAALLLPFGFVASLAAQQQEKASEKTTITLEEAVELARTNNPDYLARRNDASVADWSVREAYGGLLPGASASTSFSYQAAGTPRVGFFTGSDLGVGQIPEYYISNYSLGINYSLSGSSLLAPGRAKAARAATNAGIDAADFALVAQVTRQYLAVRRAQDGVVLAKQELERAEENRKLADARVKVGAATPIELKQAEVEKGRAEIALIQSENLQKTERLRFMQSLGVETRTDVQLTTQFVITDVPGTQEELVATALQGHPNLLAARADERANEASVKMAKSAYLPSLSLQAGVSGYTRQAGSTSSLVSQARQGAADAKTQCELFNAAASASPAPISGFPRNCGAGILTSEQERQLISSNNVFPFNYTREPFGALLEVSLPIFQGFSRERQLEEAKALASDAHHRLRGEELRLRTDVSTAYLNATTAKRSVELEQRNNELADDQLRLARERYRVGVASFLELQDANTIKARADRSYLNAIYAFHESIAALEESVGRKLR